MQGFDQLLSNKYGEMPTYVVLELFEALFCIVQYLFREFLPVRSLDVQVLV